MSFKKNTAITGFPFTLIATADGAAITTGTPVGYVTLDGGTQAAIGDVTPVHEGNGQWTFDLTAGEMNGDIVGFLIIHTSAVNVHFTMKTDTKIVSELNDIAATAIVSGGAINTTTGAVDTITTYTGNTPQTGDSFARIGANGAGLTTRMAEASINTTAGAVDTVTTLTGHTAQTGDSYGRIGVAGAGLTDLGGMSTGMKAEVNTEADTALTDYDPPTNAEMVARTPTAAQLAYITAHAATAPPITFTGGSTTTAILGNVDGSAASTTDDFYNGRVLIFNAGTLDEQATDITDYVGSTKTATITAVTTSVTSGHTAILV